MSNILERIEIVWVKASIASPSTPRRVLTAISEQDNRIELRHDVTFEPNDGYWYDRAGDPVNVLWWSDEAPAPYWYDFARSSMEAK